jgi:N-carbamoyl-L-amino-acid hydrolase
MNLTIDIARLSDEIDTLAGFSEAPAPAVTRVLFSQEDQFARAWFRERCEAAGLELRQDAVGNVFARWEGTEPDLPAFATGSHIDAIPNAGKYDGVVGVLGGLEAIRALKAAGVSLRHSVDLLLFTAEEPTRFGIGCLGSRLLAGRLDPDKAQALKDKEGITLAQWRESAGWEGPLSSVRLGASQYGAFFELHIEQGPILETEGIDIGVVEAIAAPAALRIKLVGEGGHAGAVLMPQRKDAGLGAAEIALAVEKLVLASGSPDGVGTTGVLRILPGAINSVPCEAYLEIDIRDTRLESRDWVVNGVQREARAIAEQRGLQLDIEVISSDPPATCDPHLVQLVHSAVQQAGCSGRPMISRAYHDSLFMAQIMPTVMIFIPCYKGYSHRPDEYSTAEAIKNGVEVLARALALADKVLDA